MQIPVSNILEKYQSRLQWVKIEGGKHTERKREREREAEGVQLGRWQS